MDNPIVAELSRIFSILNEKLFDGEIRKVPISIQPKKKVSIKFSPDTNTIVVGSEFTSLDTKEIPSIFLHEMIHIWNFQGGVVDVTTNQYHNKEFLHAALSVGLVVIKHKTQGWSITSTVYPRNVTSPSYVMKPSKEKVVNRVNAFGEIKLDKSIFRVGRSDLREKVKTGRPPKTYFLKYQCKCPPPHNSIRSGRRPDGPNALSIQCMHCKAKFECVTDLGKGASLQ